MIRGLQSMRENWCKIMMTSWNGNISALLALCAVNSPVTDEFPSQRPVTRSFDVFFYLRLNKQLSKQSRRRWFETPLHPLWRHCNHNDVINITDDEMFVMGINLAFTQTKYANITLLNEHIEVFSTCVHLIKVIYKHCPIHFYTTCFRSVLLR